MISFADQNPGYVPIVVIGIGGAGSSVLDKINSYQMKGIKTYLIDIDKDNTPCSAGVERFTIPAKVLSDLGFEATAGAATEALANSFKAFINSLPKTEIVFTVSGLGGGVGTTLISPLIRLLREKPLWVWTLVSLPFSFEGKPRIVNAIKKLKLLQQSANAVLAIPHDKIFKMVDKNLSMREAFAPADNLCAELVVAVRKLTAREINRGKVNVRVSDIKEKTVIKRFTAFGTGEGMGPGRMNAAIEKAFSSTLLGKDVVSSADGIIINISGREGLTLDEVQQGMQHFQTLLAKEKNIVFGISVDNSLQEAVKVDILAIGLEANATIDNWDLAGIPDSGAKTQTNETPANRVQRINSSAGVNSKAKQTMLDFGKTSKGVFEKTGSTIHAGEDLDIPTFMRRKK